MIRYEYGEAIESARFLGREFLVWLWWLSASDEPRIGDVEVCLHSALTLERGGGSEAERTAMRGADPSSSREAKDALRDGKLPKSAKLHLTRNEAQWSFVLHADTMLITGLKIPALLVDKDDDGFSERDQLTAQVEEIVDDAFARFIDLRTSERWDAAAASIRAWVRGGVA